MQIRTITAGITLRRLEDQTALRRAGQFVREARAFFEGKGYTVQTARIATNPWPVYLGRRSVGAVVHEVKGLEDLCKQEGIDFLSLGYSRRPGRTAIAPDIIKETSLLSCCSRLGDRESGVDRRNVRATAEAIKRLSAETDGGYGNFRFCGWANCKPRTPFFPTAYHQGPPTFGMGLECSDLVMRAFSGADGPPEARRRLRLALERELGQIEQLARFIGRKLGMTYAGIDASIAPSPREDESIASACEKLGLKRFGYQGTLAVVEIITNALQNLPAKTCGYCGLMLPVCEDWGLARRAGEGTYDLTNLLLYSAVCGCGLDAVPLPGDTPVEVIEAILLDVATLAIKLDKPLSARLLPVPGKAAGEMTDFGSPYLVDSTILPVR